jgi:hypothetical protein
VPDESHLCVPGSVQAVSDPLTRLRVLIALVGVEAVAMGALSIYLAYGLLFDRASTETAFVVTEVVFAALATAILALLAIGLRRGQRWAKGGLGVTLQLFGLPFGVRLAQFGHWVAAVPTLVVVVAALVLFFGLQQPADPES